MQHVRDILIRLRKANLTANIRKCLFATNELTLFGFHVRDGQITPEEDKIKAVAHWKRPQNKKELMSFLGFAAISKSISEHVHVYQSSCISLTELLAKAKPNKLEWNEKAEQSFL